MATNSRESRRRKISERGSDRLAFIAARAPPPQSQLHHAPLISGEPRLSDQTSVSSNGGDKGEGDTSSSMPLKQEPVADTSHASAYHEERSVKSPLTKGGTSSDALSNPTSVVNGGEHLEPQRYHHSPLISDEPLLSDQTSASPNGGEKGEGDTSSSTPQKQEPVAETSHASAYHEKRSVKSPLPKGGTSSDALSNSTSVVNGREHLEPQRYQCKFFSPSQISSAITATQRARLLCSVAVALLVALSYLEFPLLGIRIIKSIVSFKPLYLVLLTNGTVVLSRLIFDTQGGPQRAVGREINIPSTDASGWAEQASKALEIGLMMQKVIEAVFMDCSIYSLILVCGLSFS